MSQPIPFDLNGSATGAALAYFGHPETYRITSWFPYYGPANLIRRLIRIRCFELGLSCDYVPHAHNDVRLLYDLRGLDAEWYLRMPPELKFTVIASCPPTS